MTLKIATLSTFSDISDICLATSFVSRTISIKKVRALKNYLFYGDSRIFSEVMQKLRRLRKNISDVPKFWGLYILSDISHIFKVI